MSGDMNHRIRAAAGRPVTEQDEATGHVDQDEPIGNVDLDGGTRTPPPAPGPSFSTILRAQRDGLDPEDFQRSFGDDAAWRAATEGGE